MKLAIMQPYFLPYIGYWQLLNLVDCFVIYDNIEFTKRGWINRNRILVNGRSEWISLPLRKAPDHLHVRDRWLAEDCSHAVSRILSRIENAYRRAPHHAETFEFIRSVFLGEERNLFGYVLNSVESFAAHLDVDTPMVISSAVDIDHGLKGQARVLAICKALGCSVYINSPGGVTLYDGEDFRNAGIDLAFIQPRLREYRQFDNDFVPGLSIVDVMMFNGLETTREMLAEFDLEAAT